VEPSLANEHSIVGPNTGDTVPDTADQLRVLDDATAFRAMLADHHGIRTAVVTHDGDVDWAAAL
jgi:hypothetical protein